MPIPQGFIEIKIPEGFIEEPNIPKGFVEEKPSMGGRLFTPISKQITGKSLGERTDFLNKEAERLTKEAIEKDKTPSTAEFFAKQLPASVMQTGVNVADLSPFDIALMAATYGAGKIPIKGTALGQVAKRIPIGKGFMKRASELGRLEKTLRPFKGQIGAPKITSIPPALSQKTTREQLVPTFQKLIPKKSDLITELEKQNAKVLAADRGIIPIKKQMEMAKNIKIDQSFYDNLKPGSTANTETVWAMTDDFISQLEKLGSKPTSNQIEQLSKNIIKADAIVSENARATGARNAVLNVAGEKLKYLTDQIKKLDPEAQGAAQSLLKQFQTPGFWDKFFEIRTAGLLWSPRTHIRNTVGNAIAMIYEPPKKVLAGGVNAIESFITKKPRETYIREGVADVVGGINGFTPALKNALKAFMDDSFVSDAKLFEAVKFNQAIPGKLGKIVRGSFRALTAMDEFFTTLAKTSSVYSSATKQALKEGSKNWITRASELIKNPMPEMIAGAAKEGLSRTYRQPLGKGWQSIQKGIRDNKFLRFNIPFFRTPINLFKWSVDRGPFSLVSPRNWKLIRGTPKQRADGIATIALGQLISAGMFMKATQGHITGRLAERKSEREALMRQGIMPYSIKLGHKYYSYRGLEPLSSWLALVANTAEIVKEKNNPLKPDKISQIVFETGKMMKEQPFLRGMSAVIDAFDDPERKGYEYIKSAITSSIPFSSAFRYGTNLSDPTIREKESIPDAIKAIFPQFSKELEPKRDVWGRPITREGTLWERALLPSGVSTYKPDLTEQELLSLEKFPTKILKSYKKIPLTIKERNTITRIEGSIQKQLLDKLVRTKEYQMANPQEQYEMIDKIFSETRKEIRRPFLNRKILSEFQKLKTDEEKIEFIEQVTRKRLIKE